MGGGDEENPEENESADEETQALTLADEDMEKAAKEAAESMGNPVIVVLALGILKYLGYKTTKPFLQILDQWGENKRNLMRTQNQFDVLDLERENLEKRQKNSISNDAFSPQNPTSPEMLPEHKDAIFQIFTEEFIEYENRKSVGTKMFKFLEETENPQAPNRDSIRHILNTAGKFSDVEVQEMWAKILAGEFNRPGSFSRQTIQVMASLEKRDVELFTVLCQFTVITEHNFGTNILAFVYGETHQIYTDKQITFENLQHLESLGLIHLDVWNQFHLGLANRQVTMSYGQHKIEINWAKNDIGSAKLGSVFLTRAGEELAHLCRKETVDSFGMFVYTSLISGGVPANMIRLLQNGQVIHPPP